MLPSRLEGPPQCSQPSACACMAGAPEKQAGIIHTTLLRVLMPVQLPRSVVEAIQTRCERWTQELRGTRLCITRAW